MGAFVSGASGLLNAGIGTGARAGGAGAGAGLAGGLAAAAPWLAIPAVIGAGVAYGTSPTVRKYVNGAAKPYVQDFKNSVGLTTPWGRALGWDKDMQSGKSQGGMLTGILQQSANPMSHGLLGNVFKTGTDASRRPTQQQQQEQALKELSSLGGQQPSFQGAPPLIPGTLNPVNPYINAVQQQRGYY